MQESYLVLFNLCGFAMQLLLELLVGLTPRFHVLAPHFHVLAQPVEVVHDLAPLVVKIFQIFAIL